jgi:hypothetical protein
MIDEENRRDKRRDKVNIRKKMRSRNEQPRKGRRQDGDCQEDQDEDLWSLLVDLYTVRSSL